NEPAPLKNRNPVPQRNPGSKPVFCPGPTKREARLAMLKFKYLRAALVGAVFAALILSGIASSPMEDIATTANAAIESESGSPEPIVAPSTFYSVRPDLRRCASPLCGGYLAHRRHTVS